ncbi:tetratricopeptide repeat protein [Streptomyces sp. NPDC047725]|uniref:tetratricopeptide repeat protein n=1 Tax=Streptomyces sp. NPDC047725 TaxID=3365487 RepID=UPI00370F8815
MSRLGRDEQRNQRRAERAPVPAQTPIDVRVRDAGGTGVREASVDGVRVVAAPGQEIQHAVLNRLHRFAVAEDRSVLATIHDERVGCVIRLRVDPDGSSHLAGDPVPMTRLSAAPEASEAPDASGCEEVSGATGPQAPAAPEVRLSAAPEVPAHPEARLSVAPGAPAAHLEAVPAQEGGAAGESAPTFTLRALPEPAAGVPGTVAPPTGVFGPPPRMDAAPPADAPAASAPESASAPRPTPAPPGPAAPSPVPAPRPAPAPASAPVSVPVSVTEGPTPGPAAPTPVPAPASAVAPPAPVPVPAVSPASDPDPAPAAAAPAPVPAPAPATASSPVTDPEPESRPTPTPARGFDAVAEAVLGDVPLTAPGDGTAPALLAGPTARINEAVKEGRTQEAARLAERTVGEATDTLGPEHPEVLRLRELTAYIAYLSGDPARAFRLSLDLARIHRRADDAEAAYGNVQSAATAWRAVRDPELGLELGRDLLDLWDGLAAEAGPAADDAEELESARARMGRLTARARAHARAD